ncbi:MAG TPA: DUF4129 domain-containing protein, partial [Gemmataceae bacterium]|nr:DUF4129 domain-containing protein [Gemmataceae bacterium]
MASETHIEVRPRSTGEILDDAWRLFLARPAFLLALSAPFTVPWAAALLLVLTQPASRNFLEAMVLPAIAAALLPLTGLGAGACQEAFRRLAQGKTPSLAECYAGAFRHGVYHVVARAVAWGGALVAAVCVVMPGLIVWIGTGPVHAIIAGEDARWWAALTTAGRECQRYPAKALIVALIRPVVLLFAAANLHLLIQGVLWAGSTLVGIDLPHVAVLATLGNMLYDVVLLLFCWLLLVPFAEAANYLLHLDARARFEGLDLHYRVQQVFGTRTVARVSAMILALAAGLAWTSQANAAPLDVVRQAHQEVSAIAGEMAQATPFPGAARWAGRLTNVATQLDAVVGGRGCRWFREAIAGFSGRTQADALRVVRDLEARLQVWETSLARDHEEGQAGFSKDQIKALLPKEQTAPEASPADKPRPNEDEIPEPRPKHRHDDSGHVARRSSDTGVVTGQLGGLGAIGKALLLGLCVAAFAFGVVKAVQHWKAKEPAKPIVQVTPALPSLESLLTEPDPKMAQGLWRQADELAGRGQFLEATRSLYLAVLALLHSAGLIRYERVRTNHEYASQLRPRQELHRPFVRLTHWFEVKWYGERACQAEDFATCRELAEQI